MINIQKSTKKYFLLLSLISSAYAGEKSGADVFEGETYHDAVEEQEEGSTKSEKNSEPLLRRGKLLRKRALDAMERQDDDRLMYNKKAKSDELSMENETSIRKRDGKILGKNLENEKKKLTNFANEEASINLLNKETKEDILFVQELYQQRYEEKTDEAQKDLLENQVDIKIKNNKLYIVVRGTCTKKDIETDFDMVPLPLEETKGLGFDPDEFGFCHRGFYKRYAGLIDMVKREIFKKMENARKKGEKIEQIVFGGHSLGGPVSVLLAMNLSKTSDMQVPIKVIMMAPPRIFDEGAAKQATKILGEENIYHIFWNCDFINFLPPAEVGYTHFGQHFYQPTYGPTGKKLDFHGDNDHTPNRAETKFDMKQAFSGSVHQAIIDPEKLIFTTDPKFLQLDEKREADALKIFVYSVSSPFAHKLRGWISNKDVSTNDLPDDLFGPDSPVIRDMKNDPLLKDIINKSLDSGVPLLWSQYPGALAKITNMKTLLVWDTLSASTYFVEKYPASASAIRTALGGVLSTLGLPKILYNKVKDAVSLGYDKAKGLGSRALGFFSSRQ